MSGMFRYVPQISEVAHHWPDVPVDVMRWLLERDRQLEDYLATPFPVVGGKVIRSSSQAVANHDAISFDTEEFDTPGSMWESGDPTKLFIPTTGLWMIFGEVSYQVSAAGSVRQLIVTKNGLYPATGTVISAPVMPVLTVQTHVTVAATAQLVKGDYIVGQASHDAGGTLNIAGTDGETFLSALLFGAI